MRAGPSQEEIRRHNLGTLLRHVHLGGPASRAVLADRMGLNRSTILALTAELTAAGLVREELPRDTGRAGRPSLVVRPESTRVYVLAFDVGVDRLVAARVGLGGTILDRRAISRPRGPLELDEVVSTLSGLAMQMVAKAAGDAVCVGAGAAFCGMVRQADGVVRFGPNIGWRDEAFAETLAKRLDLGRRVVVGNDANLGALAEHMRGAGVGCDDMIYLHGDVGIGGGIIVGGKLLTGLGGYGGEIGHMVINPDGALCACGARGCLESEVGERALLHAAGRAEDPEVIGRDAVAAVVDAADRGDVTARDALHQVGDWLGLAVANLVNIFNPGLVVFGGMLREIYLGSAAQVRSRMATNVLAVSREKVRLRTPDLGDETTLVGAAELAFSEILNSPLEALARATSRP